jgi:hypothetical protein
VRLSGDQVPVGTRGGTGEPMVKVKRGESIVEVTRVATRQEESTDEAGAEDDGVDAEEASEDAAVAAQAAERQYDLLG